MNTTEVVLGALLGFAGAVILIPVVFWPAAKAIARLRMLADHARGSAIDARIAERIGNPDLEAADVGSETNSIFGTPGGADGTLGGTLGSAYNIHGVFMPTGVAGFDANGRTFNEDFFNGSQPLFDDISHR